jgi:hypothetical protein
MICFDQPETERIYDAAYEEAGYLMVMPYLLAAVTQTMHELFDSRGIASSSYVIPVSVDMRSSKDIKQELFCNHTSMLLFQIQGDAMRDKRLLVKEINSQMYEQVQSHLPADLLKASALLRIAPLPVLDRIFHLPFDGKIASFCFAHVSKSSYQFTEFMGVKVSNIYHLPRAPVPPGMGIFFNSFNGRLNVTISWLDGLLDSDEVLMLERGLKSRL